MAKSAAPMKKKVPLGCYLTPSELRDLRNYAAYLELGVPSVCSLIIQHELCKPKLNSLKRRYLQKVGKKEGERMTVRFGDPAIKERFAEHIRDCRLGSDDAVGVLFRSEPHEQRIRKIIGWPAGFTVESHQHIE